MDRKRISAFSCAGLILAAFCVLFSIGYGSKQISIPTVVSILFGQGEDAFEAAVIAARIPRTFFGILAGAALGVSGALMQAITRNPIADPSILGVNTGASLFVVTGIAYFNLSSGNATIWFSFAGAALTALAVYGIASIGHGGADSLKLALAGAAVSTALSSLVNTIMLPDSQVMKAFRFWQVGSISGATWKDIETMLPYLIAGFTLAVYITPALNALALGDEIATGLGINVNLTKALSALGGVLLCAATTALAGPIAFVGLMVPHLIRLAVGSNMKAVIPLSALYGGILLVFSDVLGRILGRPGELEVGIITAIIGAPVFIAIVRKARIQNI